MWCARVRFGTFGIYLSMCIEGEKKTEYTHKHELTFICPSYNGPEKNPNENYYFVNESHVYVGNDYCTYYKRGLAMIIYIDWEFQWATIRGKALLKTNKRYTVDTCNDNVRQIDFEFRNNSKNSFCIGNAVVVNASWLDNYIKYLVLVGSPCLAQLLELKPV